MKKNLTLLVLVGLVVGYSLMALSFASASFLKGTVVVIQKNTTNTYSDTTVNWTNVFGGTVTNGTNASGVTFGSYEQDVTTWSDANANTASANISVRAKAFASNGTNTITLNFRRSGDGTYFTSAEGDKFAFAFTANGTTEVNIVTNVPAQFLYGTRSIRLQSIDASNDGTNVLIYAVKLNGYTP